MMHKLTRMALALLTLMTISGAALAADPGLDLPNDPSLRLNSAPSDQKKGSLLVYNIYSSDATGGTTNNTRLSITNTNASSGVAVHLFFVDGSNCNVADQYICLTPNQTATVLASDIDPGTVGYLLAVASNIDGVPIAFDYLIGDELVKLSSGHTANLGAEAVSVAILPLLVFPVAGSNGSLVRLEFDGLCYSPLPRVLAVDNFPSRADGNDTLLIVNRIGGNYATGAGGVGTLFGLLYDDAETGISYSITNNACQVRGSLSNGFPRSVPRLETFIPAGRSGWTKFWATQTADNSSFGGGSAESRAIFGAVLNFNSSAGTTANAFSGGHNLHKLTLNPFTSIAIPVFPASCN